MYKKIEWILNEHLHNLHTKIRFNRHHGGYYIIDWSVIQSFGAINYWIYTTYDSYKKFRSEIEKSIKSRNKLLVLEIWKEKKVDKKTYREYLKVLN